MVSSRSVDLLNPFDLKGFTIPAATRNPYKYLYGFVEAAGMVNPLRSKGFSKSTDLNDNIYSNTGFWTVNGNASHSPVSSGLLLLVTLNGREDSTSTLTIVQLAITLSTGLPSLYIRSSWGGWNDWKLIG